MPQTSSNPFALGLDLGANSLGWAIVALKNEIPAELVLTGARVFPSAMEGDFDSGKEESRNRARRDARLHRRQLWRRGRRLKKTFSLLQRFELLPPGPTPTPQERQALVNNLDAAILSSAWFQAKKNSGLYPEPDHVLPYILRAAALDEKLEPFFLGRALFHLAQRRGFLSNRKRVRKVGEDDEGAVKKGIADLRTAISESGARTLGELFARLSPSQSRIRARWTARDMYENEFAKIWDAQTPHHPTLLTQDRRRLVVQAIFYQRPLKFDEDTVGNCELEPSEKRAPAYLLISQRFRLLDKVNNLKILPPGEPETALTAADRKKLVQELELKGDRTFDQIRKLLNLTKEYDFNLERGGEKKLPGNRTAAQFYAALSQRWLGMNDAQRNLLVEYIHAFEKTDKLAGAAQKKWDLDGVTAREFAQISLEPNYLNLSRKAMERLLPLLDQGLPFGAARKRVYPEAFEAKEPLLLLPPVSQCIQIRNPAVMRSLSELRRVVNAIIRAHGKPAEIHIELARELRKPKKAREEISKKNRENGKARREAAERIIKEIGIPRPSSDDIRKVLLAVECDWICPYTGRQISMRSLFSEPQFDFEHIIPFSRSLDNSFVNLTLCHNEENRNCKGNRTPHEAYVGNPARYAEVLGRVSHFKGRRHLIAEKMRRFKIGKEDLESLLAHFTSRQLGDTAYASRLAASYLGRLYGGVVDADGKKRILTPSGQITAYLRNEWRLNGILNDGPTTNGGAALKTRDDHRHHAVDAVVIALANDGSIKALSDAAQRAPAERRRRFASLQAPWPNFVDSVREQIYSVIVSHRVSKKVSGALHEETLYSVPPGGEANAERRVRKLLSSLSPAEVQAIVDPGVKQLVTSKLTALGGDPKKAFADPKNLPSFSTKDGRTIPIRRVRIAKAVPTFQLGAGPSKRNVASESNHHIEIFAELDRDGRELQWDGEVVPLHEAFRRVKAHEPVVGRDHGAQTKFKFSLMPGDILECEKAKGSRQLWVVRSISQFTTGRIELGFVSLVDARLKKEIIAARQFIRVGPDGLRKWNTRKVALSPLGEISDAND